MPVRRVFPKMRGFRSPPELVEESLLSFDQVRQRLKATERELRAFVGDGQIEDEGEEGEVASIIPPDLP